MIFEKPDDAGDNVSLASCHTVLSWRAPRRVADLFSLPASSFFVRLIQFPFFFFFSAPNAPPDLRQNRPGRNGCDDRFVVPLLFLFFPLPHSLPPFSTLSSSPSPLPSPPPLPHTHPRTPSTLAPNPPKTKSVPLPDRPRLHSPFLHLLHARHLPPFLSLFCGSVRRFRGRDGESGWVWDSGVGRVVD